MLATSMTTTMSVSDHVYEKLDEIKEEKDHQTFDSALREVLRDAGYDV